MFLLAPGPLSALEFRRLRLTTLDVTHSRSFVLQMTIGIA